MNIDGDETWSTGCGEYHMFIEGTPEDNSYEFCPYCGSDIFQLKGDV